MQIKRNYLGIEVEIVRANLRNGVFKTIISCGANLCPIDAANTVERPHGGQVKPANHFFLFLKICLILRPVLF
jgi:hypothetical protein